MFFPPSVLLHLEVSPRSRLEMRGAGLPGPAYRALQLHFHWGRPGHAGSEHSLDGQRHSMEVGWARGGGQVPCGHVRGAWVAWPDSALVFFSSDAHGACEHEVPEPGGGPGSPQWAGCVGSAVGGKGPPLSWKGVHEGLWEERLTCRWAHVEGPIGLVGFRGSLEAMGLRAAMTVSQHDSPHPLA